ncbi:MAG: amino acid ABC transporter permease [Candidatus Thioglobus sp.]|nr:amino acid ABC transporter permease [Candidatus Thioglobus sp.]
MSVFKAEIQQKPPIASVGIFAWLRANLFSSLFSGVLTVSVAYLLYLSLPPLANWALFNADFVTSSNTECTRQGACWAYVIEKIDLFIYGFYPAESYWRVQLAFALALFIIAFMRLARGRQWRFKAIILAFLMYPFVAFVLLYGGFGLEVIETHQWGGLTLTIVVAAVGIIASFPLGILLALGRQSKMKIIRLFSVLYIEFIRGVPLITILFMASVILPLFFTEEMNVDKLLRALIGITLFQAAYIAEVIRGGLQAVPTGQFEAADAIGLNFIQKMSLVILPQALKISIPNIVGSFIALFKDTTLVLIVGLFDVLAMVGLSSSDENWLGRETEGYVFVALILWIILYSMSKYSKNLERRFSTEHKI